MHNPLYAIVLQTMVGLVAIVAMAADGTAEDAIVADPALFGRYTVIIDNAVLRLDARGRPQGRRAAESLIIYLNHDKDGWSTVMGLSPEFNLAHHIGRVHDWSFADDHLSLVLSMRIGGDPYVPGGPARYHLQIPHPPSVDGATSLVGTYEGTFDGISLRDTVHVQRRPLPVARSQGWLGTAKEGSEVLPPLFFAGLTREELLARKEHPVVAAAHAAMIESDSVLSHAVLYHLSGFEGHAQRVRTLVEDRLVERGPGAHNTGFVWSDRLRDVSYGHALMADTWDAEFRDRVERYLQWIAGRLLYRPHTVTRGMDWSEGSPQQAHFRAAAGLSSLVMLGHKGAMPPPLADDTEQPRAIPALSERLTHSLLAVHQDLRLGETPSHWLVAGPIPDPLNAGQDMLDHMGGPEEFHLRVDDASTVRSGSLRAAFEVLPESSFWEHHGRQNIEFTEFFSRNYARKSDGFYHTAYYASVVNVSEAKRVRFVERTGGSQIQAWLNGQAIRDGDYLDLEVGNYALLIRAHAFSTNDWGKTWMSPAFVGVNAAEMRSDLRRRGEIHALLNAEREEDLAYFTEYDGADPRWWRLAEHAAVHMERYVDHAVGRGGWLLGGSVAVQGLNHLLEYSLLHSRRLGATISDGNNLDAIVLRKIMQSVFHDDRLSLVINGGHDSLAAEYIARVWPLLNTEVQPGVLWAWNYLLGWNPAENGDGPSIPANDGAVFTFLHYPLSMAAADPAQKIGSHWYAKDAGVVIMRNAFADGDDIICQLHLGSSMAHQRQPGVPGDIRLYGYGHHWSRPAIDPGNQPTQASASVVQIQRQHLAVLEPGERRAWIPRPDGGGLLTLDLSPSYQALKLHRGREQPLRDVFHRPLPDRLLDLGINGQRAVAVDYSGRSGAPALLVIVDQLSLPEDGPEAVWQWNLPEAVSEEGDAFLLSDQGFRLRQGEGQLDMRFISQRPLALRAHFDERLRLPGQKQGQRVHALRASGDFAAPFIAVATLGPQRETIEVTAQGRGQRWTITVGDQVIRVRGTKISFADGE